MVPLTKAFALTYVGDLMDIVKWFLFMSVRVLGQATACEPAEQ